MIILSDEDTKKLEAAYIQDVNESYAECYDNLNEVVNKIVPTGYFVHVTPNRISVLEMHELDITDEERVELEDGGDVFAKTGYITRVEEG